MKDYTVSSGNIFADLGFSNASEKLAKVKLVQLSKNNPPVTYDL